MIAKAFKGWLSLGLTLECLSAGILNGSRRILRNIFQQTEVLLFSLIRPECLKIWSKLFTTILFGYNSLFFIYADNLFEGVSFLEKNRNFASR